MNLAIAFLTVVLPVIPGPPVDIAGSAECPEVYEIVTSISVPILPQVVRPFFEGRLHDLRSGSMRTFETGRRTTGWPNDGADHCLMLDAATGWVEHDARLAAVRGFPRNEKEAKKLFRQKGRRDGGRLPWAVTDHHELLTTAFRDRDADAIVREAAILIHLAADAAQPFNTTVNRNGSMSGNLHWSTEEPTDPNRAHGTVGYRCQCPLIERCREQLGFEVRVWPGRFRRVSDPFATVMDVMVGAYADLEAILAVDRDLTSRFRIVDAESFLRVSAVYYDELAAKVASTIESHLEAGGLLAANLIGSAWLNAGSPPPERFTTGAQSNTVKTEVSGTDADYVGSRNSKVFHRGSCAHVKRISPENLVKFPTIESAESAGRRRCKACLPNVEK
ncbi:MAG: hypothetical protein JSU63_11145 [Phycisphaerales bacterium]|nr:MAG: hypothetical protein JSU63_11145 [Phycisphaerales bacterium]